MSLIVQERSNAINQNLEPIWPTSARSVGVRIIACNLVPYVASLVRQPVPEPLDHIPGRARVFAVIVTFVLVIAIGRRCGLLRL